MSIKRYPNLHAVGLTVDLIHLIMSRIRGDARKLLSEGELVTLTQEEMVDFVTRVSVILDDAVARKKVSHEPIPPGD